MISGDIAVSPEDKKDMMLAYGADDGQSFGEEFTHM